MTISIPATIVNGHLQHEYPLTDLEGQRVIATLTVMPEDSTNGSGTPKTPAQPDGEFDPEPPAWLDVENDVYFPMTRPAKRLGKVKIRVERGKPSTIVPEELPDE